MDGASRFIARRVVLATALLIGLGAASAQASPLLGGHVYGTGAAVEIEILSSTADHLTGIWLFRPEGSGFVPDRYLGSNYDVGRIVSLGPIAAGEELVLGLEVCFPANHYLLTGPGGRNPDGMAHASIDLGTPDAPVVSFEDGFGGGDLDFDDIVLEVRGASGGPPVPEPATIAIWTLCLYGLVRATRRLRRAR